jgi:hypothetical protein
MYFRWPAELNFSLHDFCTYHITRTCRHKRSPIKNSITCLASCLFADSVTGVGTNDFYFAVKEWPVKASHIPHNASLVLIKQGPKPTMLWSGRQARSGRESEYSPEARHVTARQGMAPYFRLNCSKCPAVSS